MDKRDQLFALLFLAVCVLFFDPKARAFVATSTSYYVRQDLQSITGLPGSASFFLDQSGGQIAPGASASTTFNLKSGALHSFFASLRPIYTQIHFHWRNDDGNEAAATSATGGVQDAGLTGLTRGTPKRLRVEITNLGGTVKGFSTQQFRIEYGLKSSTCAAATYTDVGAVGGDWDMASTTTNLAEGGDTTNIALGIGGVTDFNNSFLSANGAQRKIASQTGALSLPSDKFVELEYALVPLASATTTFPYCFRITNAGSATDYSYSVYPTSTISASSNSAPTVSAITLNAANPITLVASTTQNVSVGFTVTDTNGCSDVFTGGGVTTTIFRSGVGPNCAANNLNCYITSAQSNNCSAGNSAVATATIPIYYFAQPTDASSTFSLENWQASILARDTAGATSSATSTGMELNTLVAINLATTSINYGTVGAGSDTGSTNKTVGLYNVGNASSTIQISGTALLFGANLIATSSQKYATTTFTYSSGGTSLSGILSTIAGFILGAPTSTTAALKNTYWGISAPPGNPIGTYSGTATIMAAWSN